LSWTPPHRSEDFWRNNATKLTEWNNKLLKTLARLLSTSKNPVVLAVGCHDIGELVKQVPQARTYHTPWFNADGQGSTVVGGKDKDHGVDGT
jgi:V-type H+-transporting ATPase subunit H